MLSTRDLLRPEVGDDSLQTSSADVVFRLQTSSFGLYDKRWDRTRRRGRARTSELEETRKTRRSRRSDVPHGAPAVKASKTAAATTTTWCGEQAATRVVGCRYVRVGGGACGACDRVKRFWRKTALGYIATSFYILFDDSTGSRLGLASIEARSRMGIDLTHF